MKRHAKFVAVLLAVALVAAVALSGCSNANKSGVAGGEGTVETLKIGVHTSLTGQLADYGFAASEALKIAAKDLGEVKIGDKTYKVELVIKDDKGEEAEASVVAQSLADAGVKGVIGGLTSGATNAALPIYQGATIPVISGSATNPDITDKGGFNNFFRTCLRDDLQGKAIAEWAVELGAKKVVVMDDKGDYAVGLGNAVEQNLKASNVKVDREAAEAGTSDFSAQVSNIKDFAPDLVIFTGYHRDAGLLRKQMVEAGLKDTKFMGGDGIKSNEIVGEAGGAANVAGVLCTFGSLSSEQMPGYAKFAADFKAATSKDAGPYAENNYDALGALIDAMKAAGSTDGAKVIEALHTTQHAGILGTFGFDSKGDIAIKGAEGTGAIPRFELVGSEWKYQSK